MDNTRVFRALYRGSISSRPTNNFNHD
jgi:hypothetical protein